MINVIYSDHYISERYFKCDITPMRIAQCYELELYLCGSGFTCKGGLDGLSKPPWFTVDFASD